MADPSTLRLLRIAALVCLLEAAALVVMAIVEVGSLSRDRLALGVTTTVFFLAYAAALALGARGLALARSWTRAPLLLAQLIQIGLAWNFREGDTAWAAVLLAVPAIFVAVVLILPSTAEALYGAARGDDAPAP